MTGRAGGVGFTGVIEVLTAASSLVIPTIRTVAADLAARADFDLDSIDDLRMAVDDACAMLVRIAAPNARLRCEFSVRSDRVQITTEVDAAVDSLPTGSFGWWVLTCLVDEVTAVGLPTAPGQYGRVCISLTKNSGTSPDL
jgi:serine/threonine-protein kinase RsbW